MFNDIFGIPAHPLWVHGPVVFVPLLALFAAAFALVPRLRPKVDWIVVALSVLAPVLALCAKISGDRFAASRYHGRIPLPVQHHRSFGTGTFWWTLALGIAAIVMAWLTRRAIATDVAPGLLIAVRVVTLILAAIALYFMVRAGDTGAANVWGRT
jgi:hypothetical protein